MKVKSISYFLLEGLKSMAITNTAARNLTKLTVNSKEYFKENINETTQRLIQNTRTISTELLNSDKITNTEFLIIRQIANDLVYCNNLWRCKLDFNNKSNRIAIAGLIEKQIIFKTECKNLYIVSPYYIRFGEFFEVLFSTLKIVDVPELHLGLCSIVAPFKGELSNV